MRPNGGDQRRAATRAAADVESARVKREAHQRLAVRPCGVYGPIHSYSRFNGLLSEVQ